MAVGSRFRTNLHCMVPPGREVEFLVPYLYRQATHGHPPPTTQPDPPITQPDPPTTQPDPPNSADHPIATNTRPFDRGE